MTAFSLAVLAEPVVAYSLLVLGIVGLVFTAHNRTAFMPGVVGAAATLLALLAYLKVPASPPGIALLLFGVLLMNLEFLLPTFGFFGASGIATVIGGSLLLLDADGFELPGGAALQIMLALTGAAALLGATWAALRVRTLPPQT